MRKYNSGVLCISALVYLFTGLIIFKNNLYLSGLLFIVTIFSILHHHYVNNRGFDTLDWVFSIALTVYAYYIFRPHFNIYVFTFLYALLAFRVLDYFIFRAKRYRLFNYTHSVFHLLSGLIILFLFIIS